MSGKASKFGFLKQTKPEPEDETPAEPSAEPSPPPAEAPPPSPALSVVTTPSPAPAPKPKAPARQPEAPRRVGRPTGKRSDGDHVQVTAYIRTETHLEVKASLIRDPKSRDFSELVEELLAKWLKSRS